MLQAMERPSKVEVPRPISSRMMRLRSVALFRMFAVSFISTMKVDWPRERSSLAPTRVKMRSARPISALLRGHVAADLRHEREQRHLADVGALARHVRAGDDVEAVGAAIQLHVVRHEFLLDQALIEHRMAAVADAKARAFRQHRAAIAEEPGGLGEGGDDIERGQGGGGGLQLREVLQHLLAQLDEKLVLQRLRALVRAEDFVLHLLQLGRDEALAVHRGLLADVIGGHACRGWTW